MIILHHEWTQLKYSPPQHVIRMRGVLHHLHAPGQTCLCEDVLVSFMELERNNWRIWQGVGNCVLEFMATLTRDQSIPSPFHQQSMLCDFCLAMLSSTPCSFLGGLQDTFILLPSSTSNRQSERCIMTQPKLRTPLYSTFCYLWRTLMPSVVVMKPRLEQHQQNGAAIVCMVRSWEVSNH